MFRPARPAVALVAILLLCRAANAAEKDAPQRQQKRARKPNPSLAPIQDVAGLPRVLLIGDSISMGYTLPVRELLAGSANVHRIPTNGGPTTRGIESIDAWLGDIGTDVIARFALAGHEFELTRALVHVTGFLAVLSGFYFTVYVITDATYREEFLSEILDEVRQSLAVRNAYLALLSA